MRSEKHDDEEFGGSITVQLQPGCSEFAVPRRRAKNVAGCWSIWGFGRGRPSSHGKVRC